MYVVVKEIYVSGVEYTTSLENLLLVKEDYGHYYASFKCPINNDKSKIRIRIDDDEYAKLKKLMSKANKMEARLAELEMKRVEDHTRVLKWNKKDLELLDGMEV